MAVGTVVRLLSVLSAECDELALRVDEMHRFLPDASGKRQASDDDLITAAQDIDFVQQHLAELAQFLMLMAEWTPGDLPLDMDGPLQSIRLSDLRSRLSGDDGSTDTGPKVRAGELEML
ncbi:hypothetical protein GCM10011390_41300 [Aureimonas endophytica]|uniref:Uncharacterized protein n=1 Tax=Aureimonas endophytica TaxID=2027858 RepID=A0A916ZYD6_9HYPH|nr:hypothetical protein [Aureimonas endophytica]GGE17856.1 hypothetical protein GCM10011390_41300 [Aureimonas endophytica]